jgi:hypothetical protein
LAGQTLPNISARKAQLSAFFTPLRPTLLEEIGIRIADGTGFAGIVVSGELGAALKQSDVGDCPMGVIKKTGEESSQ